MTRTLVHPTYTSLSKNSFYLNIFMCKEFVYLIATFMAHSLALIAWSGCNKWHHSKLVPMN